MRISISVEDGGINMGDDICQDITCPCGNNTFIMKENISGPFRSLYIECSKCGKAMSHGAGMTIRDFILVMKGKFQF